MLELVILSDQDVESLVTFEENMKMIEKAFADFTLGKSHVFPVVREEIQKHSGIFGIKSGYIEDQDVLGFKAGGFWKNNMSRGLTNHQSTMVLFDPETGQASAIVAANFVTKIRTAALGAIACKYLARPDSAVLTVIGSGMQGKNQLDAALRVLTEIKKIILYDIFQESSLKMAGELKHLTQEIQVAASPEDACREADVILTTTPSYQAIVKADWVKAGTHINAIGTDTRGKQELDPQLFAKAGKIVVDNIEQCLYLGECQHAYNQGLITRESIHGEIGEIIAGFKPPRENLTEITLFDTSGVAIQDLATAGYALKMARENGLGIRISI